MSQDAGDLARAHLCVAGRVQGVWFRGAMLEEAHRLGVAGWVRNLPDGTVEAVVEAPRRLVDRMIAWSRIGPSSARVDDVRVVWEPLEGLSRFEIRYDRSE